MVSDSWTNILTLVVDLKFPILHALLQLSSSSESNGWDLGSREGNMVLRQMAQAVDSGVKSEM